MRFFQIKRRDPFESEWPLATAVSATSPLVKWWCDKCGRAASYPSGSFDATLEGGTAYPDLLGCGAYPLFIVSRRVVSDWREAGIDTFRTTPVRVGRVIDSALRLEDCPEYFRVEPVGECFVDFDASKVNITTVCRRCGSATFDPPAVESFSILRGSWDGAPLFRDARYLPRVIFCVQQVAELAARRHHTNFRFAPAPIV